MWKVLKFTAAALFLAVAAMAFFMSTGTIPDTKVVPGWTLSDNAKKESTHR